MVSSCVDTEFVKKSLHFVASYIELQKNYSASGFVSVLVSRQEDGSIGARLECCIFSLEGRSDITFDDINAITDKSFHYAYLDSECYSVDSASVSISCYIPMHPTDDWTSTLKALKNEIKGLDCELTVSVGDGAVMIGKK
ncbi:MAG: hypothetical protein IKV53_05745 [Clostridia bacterium]|nr:hypothetical protein [Clostridia bacterium]